MVTVMSIILTILKGLIYIGLNLPLIVVHSGQEDTSAVEMNRYAIFSF